MSETNKKPIIILAFANDQDDYLNMIVRERKNVFKALQKYHDKGAIQVHKEENTSIEDFFELFNRYAGRIAIFHYGGHANGTHLQLEAGAGAAQLADAGGLAQVMGQQEALQLVFLNGCATQDQVKLLFSCGIKAVIATSVPIDDAMATEFAEQFYHALASKATIQKAFQTAKAFVAAKYGQSKQVGEFRDLVWNGQEQNTPLAPLKGGNTKTEAPPWGLYVNENCEEALQWHLPESVEHQVIIRGAAVSAKAGAPVNTELTKTLLEQIARHSKKISRLLEDMEEDEEEFDERVIRQTIIDCFPAPVGEQLRKLFASNTIDVQRLQQLVVTYETIVELFCFTILSQLWDARHSDQALRISADHLAEFNSFFALSADSQPAFNYIKLIAAVADIFSENKIAPFVEEFADLNEALKQDAFDQAHRFMEEMRAELLQGKVAAEEIESFCVQAEKHLGAIITAFAFLVKYKLTTIKRIDIVKLRHRAPMYRHNQVMLDRVTAGTLDRESEYTSFTDSQSVILLKTVKDVDHYLSLSPFVIDENALTGDENSKLFFYAFHDSNDDSYHFHFVDNPEDKLIVSESQYPQIKAQFDEFKQAVFGKGELDR